MAVKVYRDGRVKLSGKDYTNHKKEVWRSQSKRCAGCGMFLPFEFAQFDHAKGRGMGGSKRNDLDPANTVKCEECHSLRHWRERDLAAKV